MIFIFNCILSFFIIQVISIPLLNNNNNAKESITKLPPPDEDPFYQPPIGFEKEKEGTILKIREAPHPLVAFRQLPQNLKKVYQILYRTTDSFHQPIATVTTLIEPYHADPLKVISYQLAEDRATTLCAPSYIFQKDTQQDENHDTAFGLQVELLFIDALLQQGWFVNLPDYENAKSMFTVGKANAHAILDSLRAVLVSSTFQTNLLPNAQIQMVGYSGGAFSTAWAVQLHSTYAPELNIIGTSLGGIPVNIIDTLNMINNTPNSNYIFSSILGLSEQYEDFKNYIDQHMKPEKRKELDILKHQCSTTAFDNKNIDDYFDRPNALLDPIPIQILKENSLGEMTSQEENQKQPIINIPLFIYHSQQDQISPVENVKQLVSQWCSNGATIELLIDELSEHHTMAVTGAFSALSFLMDRFDQIPVSSVPSSPNGHCKQSSTLSTLVNSKAIGIFGTQFLDALTTFFNVPIGP
ncbi:unnamed protein product [Cunninghamella blakesleeana]